MSIDELRVNINKIDDEILQLLNQRMEFVKNIGELKQTNNTPIYNPKREQEILQRLYAKKSPILSKAAIEAIYLEIFAVSRNLEMAEVIAFLGPKGSYTHQAAESSFGAMGNYLAISSIEGVFNVLENKEARYGVIPIENNTEGAVGVSLDCLGRSKNVKIVAEIYMDIHHSFVTKASNLEDIKKIYSHPQGYNQCRKFLDEHMLLKVEFIPTKSTAQAAKLASSEPNSAAICSKIAAKLYNVPIFFDVIEDNLANRTRFLVLSDFKNQASKRNKTSIMAKTAHKPGALARFLQSFDDAKVNLTKIESRPTKEREFKTIFYIDFEGHIDDENVQRVFEQNKQENEILWLGSYIAGE